MYPVTQGVIMLYGQVVQHIDTIVINNLSRRDDHISQLGKLARKAMWSENVPFHGFGSAEMRGLYTTMLSICSSVCLFVR